LPDLLNLTKDFNLKTLSEEQKPLFEKMLKELMKKPLVRDDLRLAAE